MALGRYLGRHLGGGREGRAVTGSPAAPARLRAAADRGARGRARARRRPARDRAGRHRPGRPDRRPRRSARVPGTRAAAVGALAVAGVGGALDRRLRPGTIVVATEYATDGGDGPVIRARRRRCSRPSCAGAGLAVTGRADRVHDRGWSTGQAGERLAAGGRARRRHGVGAARWAPPGDRPSPCVRAVVRPRPSRRCTRRPCGGLARARALRACGPVLERWAAAAGRPAGPPRRRRGRSAPASSGPSRSSSGRSSASAPRSTSAARSSTTARGRRPRVAGAPCSWRSSTRCPTAPTVVFSAHGVAPAVRAEAAAPRPAGRSTPPARWSPRSTARPAGSPTRATRSCSSATPATTRSRAPWARRPDAITRRRPPTDVDALGQPTSRPGRLPHPDHAGRRRSAVGRRRLCASASPPSSGRAPTTSATPPRTARTRSRPSPAACDLVLVVGSAQLVELAPPGRGGAARRVPGRAGRGRDRARAWPGSPARDRRRSPPARPRPRHWSTGRRGAARRSGPSRSRSAPVATEHCQLLPAGGGPAAWPSRCARASGSAPTCCGRSCAGGDEVPAHRRARAAVRLQPRVRRAAARSSTRPTSCASGACRSSRRSPPSRSAARRWCRSPAASRCCTPRSTRSCGELVEAQDLRLPVHQRRAARAQARPLHAVARTSPGSSTSTGCGSATTRRSAATASSTRRSRRSGRQGRGLPGHHQLHVLQHRLARDGPRRARLPQRRPRGRRDDDLARLRLREGARPGALPRRDADPRAVPRGVRGRDGASGGGSTTRRCSSTSSRARRTSSARRGAFPSYSVFGWQRPCYLMADGYAETYQELLETTDWAHTAAARTRAAPTAWPTAATSRRPCSPPWDRSKSRCGQSAVPERHPDRHTRPTGHHGHARHLRRATIGVCLAGRGLRCPGLARGGAPRVARDVVPRLLGAARLVWPGRRCLACWGRRASCGPGGRPRLLGAARLVWPGRQASSGRVPQPQTPGEYAPRVVSAGGVPITPRSWSPDPVVRP